MSGIIKKRSIGYEPLEPNDLQGVNLYSFGLVIYPDGKCKLSYCMNCQEFSEKNYLIRFGNKILNQYQCRNPQCRDTINIWTHLTPHNLAISRVRKVEITRLLNVFNRPYLDFLKVTCRGRVY